jgi:hypothetical protein
VFAKEFCEIGHGRKITPFQPVKGSGIQRRIAAFDANGRLRSGHHVRFHAPQNSVE